jgi:hypothetical protein
MSEETGFWLWIILSGKKPPIKMVDR